MKRKIVSGVMLTLLLMSMLTLAFNIQPLTASGTTYIKADGINVSGSPTVEWNTTYGGAGSDEARSIVQTSDGGYAIAGFTTSFGSGNGDFWLIKTDANGNAQWNKTYGGIERDWAYSLVQTGDAGYALAGPTYSFGMGNGDFWLVKTDSNGEMQWNKTYGGVNWEEPRCMVQTSDGGYAIAGFTTSYGAGSRDFWLVKTDADGNEQWNKTYGGRFGEEAYSLVETVDGGYALLGTTMSFGAGWGDFWLVKTDANGNVQWNRTYGEHLCTEEASSLVQTVDGGFALAGGKEPVVYPYNNDFWLVKTDSEGNVEWSRTYDQSLDFAWSLTQTSYQGYLLAGDTNSTGSYDFWIVKVNRGGLVQWNITLGGSSMEQPRCVIRTSDGGYAIVGQTYSYGTGAEDIWLLKLAPIPPIDDIGITNVTPPKTVVGQGYNLNINATAANQGDYTETFNVTLYAQSQEAINETGLVGYWKLDEGTGTTAYDSSGNIKHGTIYGATWTSGKAGNALQFDGVDDYVEIPSLYASSPSALTVAVWINSPLPTNVEGLDVVHHFRHGEFGMGLDTTGTIDFTVKLANGKWYSLTAPTTPGVWHHLAGVWKKGDSVKLYIDGALLGQIPVPNDYLFDTYWLDASIGSQSGQKKFFPGVIDEVRVYTRALSEKEIGALVGRIAIQNQTVTLESGASTTLTFTWNTTGFAKGNYTISAYAHAVPYETDLDDNTRAAGECVCVSIVGDVDCDGDVDLYDAVTLLYHYGAKQGQPQYDPNYDIDGDGDIDLYDAVTLLYHYGQKDP